MSTTKTAEIWYFDSVVAISSEKGKILTKKKGNATYVLYQYGQVYKPDKKYAIPQRTVIGKISLESSDMMFPNEWFQEFFPTVVLPEKLPEAYRSCALRIGSYAIIKKVLEAYKIPQMLMNYFYKESGLILDFVSYMIVDEENAGQYYPDFAFNHPLFDLFGTDMRHDKDILDADIIVLHWVNSFISDRSICQLMKLGKPIFWVMHDMWPFTGGCHYDLYCESYKSDCASCPMLKKQRLRNISAFNLKRKRNLFASMNITMIAISRWEQRCAQESFPLKGKKVILFGADKALENATKGFSYLVEALRRMDGSKYVAVCFGKAPEKDRIQLPNIDIKYPGTIQDEKKLAAWYSLADVFVAPSIQEAFGYTVCEALACGTPVTAFAVGGMLDQIDHRENGYLARLYDVEDLAEGIEFCAENTKTLGKRARETVLERNSYEVIGKKYKEVLEG